MALVTEIREKEVPSGGKHLPVDCTFDVVVSDGAKYLQLDTYGSRGRKLPGKKSQSIRFTPEAIDRLKEIIRSRGL